MTHPQPSRPRLLFASGASLRLTMTGREGSEMAVGTGFIVRAEDGALSLATALHNLSGRGADGRPRLSTGATPIAVSVRHTRARPQDSWVSRSYPVVDGEGRALWLEHPELSSQVDVAVLPLEGYDSSDPVAIRTSYTLGPGGLLRGYDGDPDTAGGVALVPGSDLFVVGFPFGETGAGDFAIWTRATVASEPSLPYRDLPMFLVDARTRKGQSGSPVVYDATGRMTMFLGGGGILMMGGTQLAGLYTGRIREDADLGFVWNTQAIADVANGGRRSALEQAPPG